jgi:DNA primase
MVYVNKKDEVRFHCFGACKGDWDIYDLIMLRMKCRSERHSRFGPSIWVSRISS